jgi:hypothetical protein
VLYIPKMKKNFLSVSSMEDKGFVVNFKRGKVLIYPHKAIPGTTIVIRVRESTLYRLQINLVQDLVHDRDNLCELWHNNLGHLHYMVLLIPMGIFIGIPEFCVE